MIKVMMVAVSVIKVPCLFVWITNAMHVNLMGLQLYHTAFLKKYSFAYVLLNYFILHCLNQLCLSLNKIRDEGEAAMCLKIRQKHIKNRLISAYVDFPEEFLVRERRLNSNMKIIE